MQIASEAIFQPKMDLSHSGESFVFHQVVRVVTQCDSYRLRGKDILHTDMNGVIHVTRYVERGAAVFDFDRILADLIEEEAIILAVGHEGDEQ